MASQGSHVIYVLQKTRRYKVISLDNNHNSNPTALDRVSQLSKSELTSDHDTEIDSYKCDLTQPDQIRAVFETYGKAGIWGVIHIAVSLVFFYPLLSLPSPSLVAGIQSCWRIDGNSFNILCQQCRSYYFSPSNHGRVRLQTNSLLVVSNGLWHTPNHSHPGDYSLAGRQPLWKNQGDG
jgi:hypothetical protein